jgi:peptide/nickel transport system substrate-binding protein
VREAELSLDREAIVQVAMDGEAVAGNQWVAPTNAWYAKSEPIPKRDVNRAKALLREAGVTNPSFTLLTPTTADAQRVAQVVQSMAKEAGFDVKIQLTEFATTLNLADKGQYEAFVLAWSGRADPDGNIYSHLVSKQPLNYAGYATPSSTSDHGVARDERRAQREAFSGGEARHRDRPIVYLYHRQWLWAHTNRLRDSSIPTDGAVRNLKLN